MLHPHKSRWTYVVHNGVIENREEIKKIIDPKLLLSETDTELIPHLIHHFYEKKFNFLKSVFNSIKWLKGSYAVVAIHEKKKNEMIAFKSGPPLIFCEGEGEYFISSDVHAIPEGVKKALFLDDEQVLHIKKGKNLSV